jgi:predicted nucleotide-binding protein (sugar kinase/HSP70/actin superfamily)
MFTLTDENGYAGLGTDILLQAWKGILLTDILSDIRSMLKVTAVNPGYAMSVLNSSWKKCIAYFEGKLSIRFSSLLKFLSLRIAEIPLKANPYDIPVISLTGEIFVRRDEFSRKNIVDYLEKQGFMVRITPLAEYICYGNYIVNNKLGERKFTILNQIKFRIVSQIQEWWEKRIKSIMYTSGVYKPEMIDVEKTIHGVNHLINENFRGECILTIGVAMREILNDSCGVISIGPFGCMYSRMAESILKKEMTLEGKKRMPGWNNSSNLFKGIDKLPFLSIESDGNPFPQLTEANLESFVLQA